MDLLLSLCFDPRNGASERWQRAISQAVTKGISRELLLEICYGRRINDDGQEEPSLYERAFLAIATGQYKVSIPHTALIPKNDKPGEFREVMINEPFDRVFLTVINNILFETCHDMIHPSCKSYQTGISCSDVAIEVSNRIGSSDEICGWQSDLRKYFDNVELRYIEQCFDDVESRVGHSRIIDVLRVYYREEAYFEGNTTEIRYKKQSLKQGCAVASFLADAILYDVDKRMSDMAADGGWFYYRYSDDQIYGGPNHLEAMAELKRMLAEMELSINERKLKWLDRFHWNKFLGFSIKGSERSLSNTAVKKFKQDIEAVTIRRSRTTYRKALHAITHILYIGDGEHSWGTRLLRTINNQHDIDQLNDFVMDCLRAVITKRRKLGGLSYMATQKDGCISRTKGRNVTTNRRKTGDDLPGYYSIRCMQHALHTSRDMYEMLAAEMMSA